MRELLKTYQKRLSNLSENNRSLFLPKTTDRQFIDVHRFDFLDHKPSFTIIDRLIAQRKKIVLSQDIDSRDKDANQVGRILKNILRTDKLIREERDAKDLLLGYPFVEGKMQNDKCVRCPLIFFPIKLWKERQKWHLGFRDTEEIKLNQTFLLAYSQFNKEIFDQKLLDISLNEFSKDSQIFRNQLYERIQQSSLELNFNQRIFEDRLLPFSAITKHDFSLLNQTGVLKLMPHAVMGVFARSDSFLEPDYDFLIQKSENKSAENLLFNIENQSFKNKDSQLISEQNVIAPFQVDASQESVLKQVKLGHSIAVQGPPGAGKSQLICNLISDCIANQKRVLLVCQKRAALDVVYQRLSTKNINKYIGLVHDFRNDRNKIYQQLSECIQTIYERKKEAFDVEIYQLEERFLLLSREIDQNTSELNQFHQALFEDSEFGISVKELYLTSDFNAPHLDFSEVYQFFNFSKIYDFEKKLRTYFLYRQKLESKDYAWRSRKSFAQRNVKDLAKLKTLLLNFVDFKNTFDDHAQKLVDQKLSYHQIHLLIDQKNLFSLWLGYLEEETAMQYFQKILKFENANLESLTALEKNILACYENQSIETSLPTHKLEEYEQILQTYQEAQKSFIMRQKWSFLSQDKLKLKKLFKLNDLEFDVINTNKIHQKIQNRKKLEEYRQALIHTDWLSPSTSDTEKLRTIDNLYHIARTLNKKDFELYFMHYRSALKAKNLWEDSISYFLHRVIHKYDTYRKISKMLFEASLILRDYLLKKKEYLFYLSRQQFELLWGKPKNAKNWNNVLERDFDDLRHFDELRHSFSNEESQVVQMLENYDTDQSIEGYLNLFNNSIRIEWILHIESKYPVLRMVSSSKIYQLEQSIQKATQDKQQISEMILKIRVQEQRMTNLVFNRLGNIVSYRDLNHQVNKKRNIWALRKIFNVFSEEIFRLMPCWMMSPESVSAIFEPTKIFDLVIFDEASQCYAQNGIPAMYRGKQVIIIGDKEQLQPSNLYTPKWEQDIECNTPLLEIDSVLDLGNYYLRNMNLKGHYRSESLDLIDFSNQHFYKNTLTLVPDYHDFIRSKPSIQFEKVQGVWQNQTNPIEAQSIVTLIQQLISEGQQSIGVITFNFPQQMLILDLLEKREVLFPKNFFVKNIENVQGDERDIIIFSIGYAPNQNGKFRMNFGLLSQEKGENRLNVAITRARKKIYVISSIYPHHMQTEELKHAGAKLLQKYLYYALEISEKRYVPSYHLPKKYHFSRFLKQQIMTYFDVPNKAYQMSSYQLPFSDLLVVLSDQKNELRHKLILTDDDLFYEAHSPKENHVYVPKLLTTKNWTFLRVYSREFWRNRTLFFQKIKDFIASGF